MRGERVYWFLVVLLLILPAKIFAQQQMPRIGQYSPHILQFSEGLRKNLELSDPNKKSYHYLFTNGVSPVSVNPFTIRMIQPQFYISNLPFFCKKEFEFEKSTAIPLRVRLGSLEYVNRLEGKEDR
ncbi:MAG TPA: hypothetical protein VK588_11745 [Chitinophagaceae bacterium]|nr:hypothetical protein [Chitinophagaceae bacterium]